MAIAADAFRNAVRDEAALMRGLREAELPPLLMVLREPERGRSLLAEFVPHIRSMCRATSLPR